MHIARIRHLFYPDMPRDYFYELSARQVKRGHDVDVFSWRRKGACSEEKVAEGFMIYRLNGLNLNLGGLIQEYPYLPELPSKLETLRPDIVHGESHLFLPTVQAVMKAKKLGLPCVVTVHGVLADRGFAINLAQNLYLSTLGSKIFKSARKVICLTRRNANDIANFGCPMEKIVIIPNAVDTNLFSPESKPNENLVVWVGRFVPEKGLDYLIEAAKLVAGSFRDVEFLLIGYGPQENRIMKLAHQCGLLGRNVRFTGKLTRFEIATILKKAAAFVFPSLSEGMPVALMEAMSSGVPIVGSNIPGVNDLVVDGVNGLLVPPRDSSSLAMAITSLMEDPKRRKRMSASARTSIIHDYSWSSVLQKIDAVYNEIAG